MRVVDNTIARTAIVAALCAYGQACGAHGASTNDDPSPSTGEPNGPLAEDPDQGAPPNGSDPSQAPGTGPSEVPPAGPGPTPNAPAQPADGPSEDAPSDQPAAGDAGGGPTPACTAECDPGFHCELVQVTCIRAPCPPQPSCMADGADGGTLNGDAGTGDGDGVDCDARRIQCRRLAPSCPDGQVPSIVGTCYGACVPIGDCVCSEPDACPDRDHYVCHNFAQRCGPYL